MCPGMYKTKRQSTKRACLCFSFTFQQIFLSWHNNPTIHISIHSKFSSEVDQQLLEFIPGQRKKSFT